MQLTGLRMAGNVYNRCDADKWMTAQPAASTEKAVFLDMERPVLMGREFTKGLEDEGIMGFDFPAFFESLRS